MALLTIEQVIPTPCLREGENGLEQCWTVTIRNAGDSTVYARVELKGCGYVLHADLVGITPGVSEHQFFVPEPREPGRVLLRLLQNGECCDEKEQKIKPPRHWTVHVVHYSHHDAGFTDLPSQVPSEHSAFLTSALEDIERTLSYPENDQMRISVEQFWSLQHFLRTASKRDAGRLEEKVKSGHIEVNGLFGNLAADLCDHTTLFEALYPARAFCDSLGVPLISAVHDDMPGFPWGLAEALVQSGIRFFCPQLPYWYYKLDGQTRPNLWDAETILGNPNVPGAFWWEAPSGRKVLVWINHGAGEFYDHNLDYLPHHLNKLEAAGYPYSILRYPVKGAGRDNAPYIRDFAETIHRWNREWIYPRFVSSTNTAFYQHLQDHLPLDLPVWRGGVPEQDYINGASATPAATAVRCEAGRDILAAETFENLAGGVQQQSHVQTDLQSAWEESLWYDEHTWGNSFLAGPSAEAAVREKTLHAYRAAALGQRALQNSMASIGDRVNVEEPEKLHLMVFNPLARSRADFVSMPLRELQAAGSRLYREENTGRVQSVSLGNRNYLTPPDDILDKPYALVDIETGQEVPFEIISVASHEQPVSYASARAGYRETGVRYPQQATFATVGYELQFVVENIPACGFRTYRLEPRAARPRNAKRSTVSTTVLENQYYRVEIDKDRGGLRSLYDKELDREFLGTESVYSCGLPLIRHPEEGESEAALRDVRVSRHDSLIKAIELVYSARGHPNMIVSVSIPEKMRRVDIELFTLMDGTPLLEGLMPFPLHMQAPETRIETPLALLDPVTECLPGAHRNRLSARNVCVRDSDAGVVFSTLDTPLVTLGRAHAHRLSPAHAGVTSSAVDNAPLEDDQINSGGIFSVFRQNNFGTNFPNYATGEMLYRYRLSTRSASCELAELAEIGEEHAWTCRTVYSHGATGGQMAPVESLLHVDDALIRLIALKRADSGKWTLTLWNPTAEDRQCGVSVRYLALSSVVSLNDEATEVQLADEHLFKVTMPARSVCSWRLVSYREKVT